eukprot:481648-Lingulodinium_polyedra.AAC.1
MMRSNRPSAAWAAHTSHATARRKQFAWSARAIHAPPRRRAIDSTASLCTVFDTVRNAVESIVCRLS